MQEEVALGPHRVVVNEEEQFSLIAVGVALPAGWRDVGYEGSKTHCLAYIREAWSDQRPRSVRR